MKKNIAQCSITITPMYHARLFVVIRYRAGSVSSGPTVRPQVAFMTSGRKNPTAVAAMTFRPSVPVMASITTPSSADVSTTHTGLVSTGSSMMKTE